MNTFITAYIGIGSNQGDKESLIRSAVAALQNLNPRVKNLRLSPLYETPPLVESGFAESQGENRELDWFLNGVIEMETSLSAEDLLFCLQAIEKDLGRQRPKASERTSSREIRPFVSRTMDLDLLFYGSEIIETPALTVPHPRAHQRSFVMIPMGDLNRNYIHPVLGKTIGQLCRESLQPQPIRRRDG